MPHSLCSEERGTLLLQLFTAIIFLLSLLCNSAAARGAFSQDQTFVRRIEASAPQGDLSRQKRTVTEFIKGIFGYGNKATPTPTDGTDSSAVAQSTTTETVPVDNGGSSGITDNKDPGSSASKGSPPAVREGPKPGTVGSDGSNLQKFTGNKWIDTAINAATNSGSGTENDPKNSVGGRIVDALVKEGMKSLIGSFLG